MDDNIESLDLSPLEADIRIVSPLNISSEKEDASSEASTSDPPRLFDEDLVDSLLVTTVPEPIRLRGVGGSTVFGLNSKFEDEFPSLLTGKVAPEEFQATVHYVNILLVKSIPFSVKYLLLGCLCCCCTLGLSLGPVFILNKMTKYKIRKLLDMENHRLYNKLGLHWRLSWEQRDGTNLREYVSNLQKQIIK